MVDPTAGDRGLSGANAAAEAARQAAAEAARRAAQEAAAERARQAAAERARQAAADRLEARLAQAEGSRRFGSPIPAAPSAIGSGAGVSLADAQRLAAAPAGAGAPATSVGASVKADRWWEDPQPPGTVPVVVSARADADAASLVDDWIRAGKAGIGVGNPIVYDAYMRDNELALTQAARLVSPGSTPDAQALLDAGDTEGYVNLALRPALAAMADLHPDATFEVLTVERGALGTAMPGGHPIYSPQTVVRLTEDGVAQDYVLDAASLFRPTADSRAHDALNAIPGGPEAWGEAVTRLEFGQGDPETAWETLRGLGADYNIAAGLMTMDPVAQTEFLKAYGQTSDIPLGILRPIETVPGDQTVLTLDATAIARGETATSVETEVAVASANGILESTALPPMGGLDQGQWRDTLDLLAMNETPPSTVAELRTELTRLTGGTLDADALARVAAADGNALPALLNLVQDHPPVQFNDRLNLALVPGGRGVPASFESITYDAASNSVVVETSLNRFTRDDAALGENYGVADVPMTLRVPLPKSAPAGIDWSQPSRDDLAMLNQQIRDLGSASVFLHGYQSDRRVWTADMQQFMDLQGEPTLGIAFAGMGSESDFLGSGASPLTPRQYAFQTMEAMDQLGLYGLDLTVYGHSMGGAAALQMGLATDRMVAAGQASRPNVDYVLLQPAPAGDSVPFLTEGPTSVLIGIQNEMGSWPNPDFTVMTEPVITGPGLAGLGNLLLGGKIVGDLMPGAPDYIQAVHSSFASSGGFPQLKATAAGLVLQGEPDPAEIAAFMSDNRVLVVAGAEDRIVSTDTVLDLFNGQVVVVPGNHYAHLPSSIPEQDAAAGRVWPRIARFLNPETRPARGPR